MLCHNEAHLLPRLFEQIGDRIDSAAIIVHPEYEDDSLEVARTLCDKYGVKHNVVQRDPIAGGAADARNEVLDMALEFGEDYVLWLDPDDPLVGTIPDELTIPIYAVEVRAKGTAWLVEHLVSKDVPDVRFYGDLHESLLRHGHPFELLNDCYIDRSQGSGGGEDRMRNQDLPTLLAKVEADPDDGHHWYYLAQTYRDLGMKPEAVAAFNHRAEMGGLQAMIYWCRFQVAEITQSPDDYLTAYNCHPGRVEALHRLAATYNARSQYATARMFCLVGLNTPPTEDGAFVERWVEEYGLMAELALAEYYIGNPDKAFKAFEYVLSLDSVWPEHRAVFENNLKEIKKEQRKQNKPVHKGRVTTKKKVAA